MLSSDIHQFPWKPSRPLSTDLARPTAYSTYLDDVEPPTAFMAMTRSRKPSSSPTSNHDPQCQGYEEKSFVVVGLS